MYHNSVNSRTIFSFFPFKIFITIILSTITGIFLAFFVKPDLTFSQIGMDALPIILVRNELVLCLIALFSFSWLIQNLVLFSNFFLQSYFIYGALSIYGTSFTVLTTVMFAFIEGNLLILLALKSQKHSTSMIRYLPFFMVLMGLSSVLEVIIL
jgi:hypothetical protein